METEDVEVFDIDEQINNAIEWITELSCGDWNQTKGTMKKRGAFCCMGVARELFGTNFEYEFDPSAPEQPTEFETYQYGLAPNNINKLVNWNDMEMITFPEISKRLICRASEVFNNDVAEGVQRRFFCNAQ